jgi:hypothetical protein
MKRKNQRTLELIFSRPIRGSLPWRDIEALFQELGGDISERAGSQAAVVLFGKVRVLSSTGPTDRQIPTRVLLLQSANGLKKTE